ncbi:MAG: hypothetical protein ACK4UN_01925, partial [Limisphaerales bacterium]
MRPFVVRLVFCFAALAFVGTTQAQTPITNRLQLLWQLAPFSRPYLTTNELPYERGMAYNPVSHNVLIASRSNRV